MASEIRVDKINSLSGVGTVTLSPTGVDIAGITTASTLRSTTGIVTSLTAGSLTSLGDVDIADKIIHTGDTNTAIRFPAADTITAETGGSERIRIKSDGSLQVPIGSDIEIGQTASSSHADGNAGSVLLGIEDGGGAMSGVKVTNVDAGTYNDQIVTFLTAQGGVSTPTERLRIASDGKIGVNISTPGTLVHQHESSSGANYHKFTNSTTGSAGSDGAYIGLDGNEQFIMWTQETGKLRFAVGDNEKVYINNDGHLGINDGNLVIGTSGHGIDFSAAGNAGGMTSELLDDYEEGTWTPDFQNRTSTVPATQEGRYRKIGSQVFAYLHLNYNVSLVTSTGLVNISGLPFTASSGHSVYGAATSIHMNNDFVVGNDEAFLNALVPPNNNIANVYFVSGSSNVHMPSSRMGTGNLLTCLVYFVN